MDKKADPTTAELEILQILWQAGPCTVRFVNEKLQKKRGVGYTTTLKLLQIMAWMCLFTIGIGITTVHFFIVHLKTVF